jgi:GNAT superfamily N-acetyltransferase
MAETPIPFEISALTDTHDRRGFSCGSEPLDRYFAAQVIQDIRRRIAACFVATLRSSGDIVGYYTLSASSIPINDVAPAMARKLPRYPLVPAVRLGRLAVAAARWGEGIGAGLLVDAMTRACRSEITAFAMVADAKDEQAVAFYRHHGFVAFASVPMCLYLPLATVSAQLGRAWTEGSK